MKRTLIPLACLALSAAAAAKPLKVFISVDMEGVGGAVDAGATQIVVKDSHGTHRNLLIEELRAPGRAHQQRRQAHGDDGGHR